MNTFDATFAKQIAFGFSSLKWGMQLLIVSFLFLMILVRFEAWKNFAQRKKWHSRICLFIFVLFFAFPLGLTGIWTQTWMPGKLSLEKPNLTATAIKLGIYGLVWRHELDNKLTPQEQALAKCVDHVSAAEAQKHQDTCGNDHACIEDIPPMTKQDIIAKIAESQKTHVPTVSDDCKNVDIAKLTAN